MNLVLMADGWLGKGGGEEVEIEEGKGRKKRRTDTYIIHPKTTET